MRATITKVEETQGKGGKTYKKMFLSNDKSYAIFGDLLKTASENINREIEYTTETNAKGYENVTSITPVAKPQATKYYHHDNKDNASIEAQVGLKELGESVRAGIAPPDLKELYFSIIRALVAHFPADKGITTATTTKPSETPRSESQGISADAAKYLDSYSHTMGYLCAQTGWDMKTIHQAGGKTKEELQTEDDRREFVQTVMKVFTDK